MFALICPNCGGPLPTAATTASQFRCDFCAVLLSPKGHQFETIDGSSPSPPDERQQQLRQSFLEAVRGGIEKTDDPRSALATALRQHFGLDTEAEVIVRVVTGLNEEFCRDNGFDNRRDSMALARLAEAYLLSQAELSTHGRALLDLPFFGADGSGPKHFKRELTVADIQALSVGTAAPSSTGQRTSPGQKAKRWWWPF